MKDNFSVPWQVDKYEALSHQKESIYFDVDDFEEIIDHYLVMGSYKQSLNAAEIACGVHPASIPLMLKKAQLLATFNKEDHALELLATLENLDPFNNDVVLTRAAIYSQLKDYQKAIEEYNKAVFGADEPDFVYCNIAIEYENLGNFDKTLEYLDKALKVNPDNDLAIYEAAYCFDLLSLTEEGITFFQQLIDRNPYSTEAWFNLGVSYINAGLYEKALEALEYSLAIDHRHEHSWFHKGYTLSLLNRHQEAIVAYKESMAEGDSDPMKHYYIGECHEKLEDYHSAKTCYLNSIRIDPELADAWVGIGICDLETGNTVGAIRHLEKGLSLDPENINYLCLLANTYFTLDQHDEAQSTYEKAIKADPEDEETWLEYAEALSNLGQWDQAQQVLTRGIESLPGRSNILYFMAAILFLSGKKQEAGFFLEEAYHHDTEGLNTLRARFPKLKENLAFLEALDNLS